ncbi:TIGR03087 family PEP-CTERM/XrtA system glycosyltransferase [Paucibacter sp. O1-1]|uniref:TIGR03087 family PEP-CTERM/XrtA system glycosyltransferase n=1 Tax=Paucibacter sp. M5-1 TaxID=3015998 RepID=UPI0021D510FB|nr:TIGR03087 family PEP-CTERM/XrtA system glycosyltransferase [Paucibacter sp. M5-1]MCU7375674.1 TIGR03087 family PEP-CTERM/XrtA system glycosyltransferase [Paucibacter sp. O1-1]MCZ7884875.1 TIGR03087 family PEP-CTERM/XrtA system glycosyltransferase [Paucibacter sp. M5-1]MDA3830682.1 TIGR03087 family PEP-CTERM/XrtA system glycosyltransferase [Paucibacter sp. O1-1]
MNILYLCHRFPFPPKRGGKIRPFNMIRHLSAAGHRVTVCSLVRAEDEGVEGQGIAPHCEAFEMARVHNPVQFLRMIVRLPLTTPSSMGYFYSPALRARVDALLASRRWDLIFVHCSSVAQYVEHVQDIPKILDFGDMDSQKWLEYANYKPFPLSLGYRLEGYKMLAAEKRLARRFDICTATTRAEWQTLDGYGTGAATDWFPNGVDAEFFSPGEQAYDADTVSFIGRMDYYPNQECMARFCAEVWPLLRAQRPAMKLLIIGADPSPQMRQLGELPGVTVTGSVPDVRPYVRQSAVMVAPLAIARGTQNKILEAMAMGVPVVTSSCAAGGVDAEDGAHLLVADTPQQIVAAILRVTGDAQERERLARAGRERMLSHHAWPRSMQRLDGIIARLVDPSVTKPNTKQEAGVA